MPNSYYHFKCPECGEELNSCRTTEHIEMSEDESQWVANYDCPKGCGTKEVYCGENVDIDEDGRITSRTWVDGASWVKSSVAK